MCFMFCFCMVDSWWLVFGGYGRRKKKERFSIGFGRSTRKINKKSDEVICCDCN